MTKSRARDCLACGNLRHHEGGLAVTDDLADLDMRDADPLTRLMFLFCVLRGGRATNDQLLADREEWEDWFGPPTHQSVSGWKKTLGVELAIGMAMTECYLEIQNPM
jgi:hypothetical protein